MTGRLRIHPFSLRDTLECGQFFRATKVLGTYLVQSSDRIFSLWQKGDILFYEGIEESFLVDFFRLDEDFESILRTIDRDSVIHQAIQEYRGMRLVRQDPWECLISYLCSSAKAIGHIRCIVELLSRASGKKIFWQNHIGYGFPEPKSIDTPEQIKSVNAGFRAGYLIKAIRSVDRTQLLELKSLPYLEARKKLMTLSGVGKKVADCVLLYSLDFLEAFPIDTWIKKGLQNTYFGRKKTGEKEMEKFVANHFGPFAGYAQLYLFHYWRHNHAAANWTE